jgi:ComF family protein
MCGNAAIDGRTHPGCVKEWGLDGLYCAVSFSGVIKDAIHEFKYRGVTDLKETLIAVLLNQYALNQEFDFLVPVPLYSFREKERGFNQSFILAKLLSQVWDVRVTKSLLVRNRSTTPQADLKKQEREKNIRGAFSLKQSVNLTGQRIGLIDDVATTRSTLLECTKVLKRAHAKSVWGIVIAHGS